MLTRLNGAPVCLYQQSSTLCSDLLCYLFLLLSCVVLFSTEHVSNYTRWLTQWASFINKTECKKTTYKRVTHRIKHQHPAEEVDSFMGRLARQCVQNRKGWLQTKQTRQHQPPSRLVPPAVPHVRGEQAVAWNSPRSKTCAMKCSSEPPHWLWWKCVHCSC